MKLPPYAKRVFKGVIFDVYHWEQEMFDGSKETFEMLKRPDTVQVIAVRGEKIIMLEEEQPGKQKFLGFPGGRMDEGEDVLTAAKRELKEETGLASDDWELHSTTQPHGKIDWRIHLLIARNCYETGKPHLDPGERITAKPVDFDEFVKITTSLSFSEVQFMVEMLHMQKDPKRLEEFRKRLGL